VIKLASNFLAAEVAISLASASEFALIFSIIFLPTRTFSTEFKPKLFKPLRVALPCGSGSCFKGIILISTLYFIVFLINYICFV